MTVKGPWKQQGRRGLPTKDTLTEAQSTILKFMKRFLLWHGVPASINEIGEKFSIKTKNGVFCHLQALLKKGAVRQSSTGYPYYLPVVPPGCCPCCSQPLPNPPEEP